MKKRTKPDNSNQFLFALGKVLQSIRESRNLAQEDVAAEIGRHRTYVSLLENGKKNATVDTLLLITDLYEVSLSEVFSIAEEQL